MAYYYGAAGDYYARGDYYGGNRGDLWKKLKKGVKKLGVVQAIKNPQQALTIGATMMGVPPGVTSSFLPQAAGGIGAVLNNAARTGLNMAIDRGMAKLSAGGGQTYVPAAVNNPIVPDFIEKMWDGTQRKRRTMNAGNAAALRRALRRVDAFRNLAKRSGAMPAVRRLQAASCKTHCK